MDSFWAKYILFELKKVERSYLSWNWRVMQNLKKKLTCCLENDIRNYSNFHQSTRKCQHWWDPFAQSRKCITLKFTKELCVMTVKKETKIEEELTWGTSQILTRALESSKNLCFNWLLVTRVYIVWAAKVQRSYLSWH